MTAANLRIDPALPICWEDLDTLRIGFECATARIPGPSAAVQRLVSAFCAGLPLTLTARGLQRFGATPAEWRDLVERIAPVLVEAESSPHPPPASPAPFRVAIAGEGDGPQHLRRALGADGISVSEAAQRPSDGFDRIPDPDPDPDPDLLVVVERFLEPSDHSHLLLAERVPQLLVRFTDRSVRIGPLSTPLASPCPGCVAQHEIDADPSLPVIAAQLFGRVPAAETSPAAAAAAALVVTSIRRWRLGGSELARAQLRLAVDEGLPALIPELRPIEAHPECRCAGFSPVPAQAPRGTPASAAKRDGVR